VTGLLLILVGAVLFTAAGVIRAARGRVRRHGIFALAWRWLSGAPHHGQAITDAGWARPGTRALTQTGHARRWWYLPRRTRALRRTASTVTAVLIAWGLVFERAATLIVLAVSAAAGTVLGVCAALLWARRRTHRRTWVEPAHLAAAELAGLPPAADPASWLEITPDRSLVIARLPPNYRADAAGRRLLAETLASRLGLEHPETTWKLAGPAPRLEITQSAPPPARVSLADALPFLERAKDDEIVWGPGKNKTVVKTSLSGESPHVGLSMGSGAGKSVTARSLLAQMLHHGAIGLVLDFKKISHHWADGLPNVVIVRSPQEIHDALIWLGEEVERRNEVTLAGMTHDGEQTANPGPRLIVVAEELNATVSQLRAYWRKIRPKDGPSRPPSLDALDMVSFTGRQVLVNLVYIGQRLSDKATGGGGDARENIGVIAMARFRPQTWKLLCPDYPMPPRVLTPGHLHVVSDRVQAAQGIFMTWAEARRWALSGIVSMLPAGMPGARATAETAARLALPAGPDQPEQDISTVFGPSPVSGGVTLTQAVEAGVFGDLTLAGVRTARYRDPAFPASTGQRGLAKLYDLQALADYAAARAAAA